MATALPPDLSGLFTGDGDAREGAWAVFLQAHSRLLLSVCRNLGRDHDAAMDAYAYLLEQLRKDGFHRLHQYAVDGRSKFTTWLVVVARRLCLDYQRHTYGRARDGQAESAEQRTTRRRLIDLVAVEIDIGAIADPLDTDPEQSLLQKEQRTHLERVLAGLEPRDRLLLKLRFEDDLSAREIGTVMGFATPFHVYRRLNTLLAGLRTRLSGDAAP